MREEHRPRVFQNRVLRGIFGAERQEVAVDFRKLYHEELNELYCSLNGVRVTVSSRMRWTGHVACMGEKRDTFRVLMGKPEGKRPLGSPRAGLEHDIKVDR